MTYNTEKRTEILNFFCKSGNESYSAEDICAAILKDGSGRSTVYRLISKLVDEGNLRRISDGRTRRVTYQYIRNGKCSEHLHLKCNECGRLIHLSDEISHVLEKRIMKTAGFALDDGALLYGKCKNCLCGAEEVRG